MRRLFIPLITAVTLGSCQGQNTDFVKIDLREISIAVIDSTSPCYYPILMTKFQSKPEDLNDNEINHLYFGYNFTDKHEVDSNQIRALEEIFDGDTSTGPEIHANRIIAICDSILEKYPFDLWVLNHELLFLEGEKLQLRLTQQKIILNAILKSGNGLSEGSSYLIIDPFHARLIAFQKNLSFDSIETNSNQIHVLRLTENSKNISALYFRIIR